MAVAGPSELENVRRYRCGDFSRIVGKDLFPDILAAKILHLACDNPSS
jgi:hypothetical protein